MNDKSRSSIYSKWRLALFFHIVFIILYSCKDDENEPTPTIENKTNTYVNAWIFDNMKTWYLWYDKLPASPNKNQDPESFFKSLIYQDDKFSWVQDNYQELLNSLEGISKEAGYEFVLYKENEGSNNVIAQILYIKPGSPAERAGLKRGDLIIQINGQTISVNNYQSLLKATQQNHEISYKPLLIEDEKFGEEKSVSLTTLEYTENPNYLHKMITTDGKKIGYYVYNFFSAGTTDTNAYDAEMDAIFAEFKTQGITDLIIDFRFNSGGSETAANNLASLIAPDINSTKIFFKRGYNKNIESAILNDPEAGPEFLIRKFTHKDSNIGNQLTGNRVYILTSSRTASASELIINGLRPYMDVFLIGDTTYGKNVGSISLYAENDPENVWGIQPIVLKAYNSLDQSDYSQGFAPNILHKDNSLYLYPLGDTREALLRNAIGHITGTISFGREGSTTGEQREIMGHSLDTKQRSFNLNIDQNIPSLFYNQKQ